MIHNPLFLILVLLAVESSILLLAGNPRTKHLFNFLPVDVLDLFFAHGVIHLRRYRC